MSHENEHSEVRIDHLILEELRYHRWLLEKVFELLRRQSPPRLRFIQIDFTRSKGETDMAPVEGAVTLTTAGQTAKATVVGFDEFGNAMPSSFVMPPVSYSIDDTAGAVAKAVDNGDGTATVTAVANGTAQLTAKVTTAEGVELSDAETITVEIAAAAPVLKSIKLAFDTGK